MIIVSAALVGVAVLLLLLGVFNDSGQPFLFGSMGASILSFIALALGVRQGRKELSGSAADADAVGPIVIDEPAEPLVANVTADRPPTVRVSAPPSLLTGDDDALDGEAEDDEDAFDEIDLTSTREIVVHDPVADTEAEPVAPRSADRAAGAATLGSARTSRGTTRTPTRSTASGARTSASRSGSAATSAKRAGGSTTSGTTAKKTTAKKTTAKKTTAKKTTAKKTTAKKTTAKKTTAKRTTAKKRTPKPPADGE